MLSLFRRLIASRLGAVIALAALIVIAIAFVIGDIGGLKLGGGAQGGPQAVIATIGSQKVTAADLRERIKSDVANFRQQQPTLTEQQYLAAGGFEGTLNRLIGGIALEEFGKQLGLAAPKKLVDQQLAAIPGLQGVDGKFNNDVYKQLLQQRGLTDRQVRADIARSIVIEQLQLPIQGATQVPTKLAEPYAALLLEERTGQVGFIPAQAIGAGAVPTAEELKSYYQRNQARFRIPERRALRVAVVTPDTLKAAATPSEAEIAAAYRAQAARFAARETRDLAQVVVSGQAQADALAAKVRGGTPIAAAAKAIGLEAATLTGVDQAGYAAQTTPELAKAVFAVPQGGVAGPVKGPLGLTVVQVQKVAKQAAQSEAQARATLIAELGKAKLAKALSDAQEQIGDAIDAKGTFADIVAKRKLVVEAVPPVTAAGIDPTNPDRRPNPALAPVLDAAFKIDPSEGPQLVPLGQDGSFALMIVDRVLPPFTPPLAELRDVVARGFTIDRAQRRAREVAAQVVAKVNKGTPLAQALEETGLALPPVQPLRAARAQLELMGARAPAPVTLAFAMAPKKAKLQAAPDGQGWLIVYLDKITRRDGAAPPQIVSARQAELGQNIGNEYLEQLVRAVRDQLKVKVDEAEVAKLRAELTEQPR
ncbi:MAG: hypothetical protein A4S12_11485 [Proteobacteria bacterium SG_bin5]|nr:SurA N-terminal domain-containing protein [Sphingomonas sp.]OQW39421.1 MAG: hypothetical protein A4S12_11485 [Proteobacteria bacterium SG_bin5]